MQNPLPIKNGGIEIFSNELMDAMCRAGFSAREWNVVMAVIRKTYGCGQQESDISLSQLERITGISKTHLSSTVRKLASAGVLIRRPGALLTHVLAFNQNYHAWNLSEQNKITESVSLQTVNSLQKESSSVELHLPFAEKTRAEGVPKKVTVPDSDTVTLRGGQSKNEEKRKKKDEFLCSEKHETFQLNEGVQETTDLVIVPEKVTMPDSGTETLLKEEFPAKRRERKKRKEAKEKKEREEKNIFCGENSKKAALNETAQAAIDHLNGVIGFNYQYVEANLRHIRARLSEGATLDELKAVVDAKVNEWGSDEEMWKYLRPETLFNATKFASYVGQVSLKKQVLKIGVRRELGGGRYMIDGRTYKADGRREVEL